MIENLFNNVTYFLPDLPMLVLTGEPEIVFEVRITDTKNGGVLFHGRLWPDWNGRLEIDLKPIIKDTFKPEFIYRTGPSYFDNYISLKIEELEYDDEVNINVNLFSILSLERMSDIDEMDVPSDYFIPVGYPNLDSVSGRIKSNREDDADLERDLQYKDDVLGLGRNYLFLKPGVWTMSPEAFYVQIDHEDGPCLSPVYHIVEGTFEQYIFYNRFGNWDNIAMNGRRTLSPEMEFSNASLGGKRCKGVSEISRKYTQNSGNLTRKTAAALMSLMDSPAIYHLTADKEWRKIIIEDCTPVINSDDSLHNLSFTYQYSEDRETYEI